MRSHGWVAAVALMAHVLAPPVAAQTGPTDDQSVSLEEVRGLRAAAERNPALSDELKARILTLYDDAIRSLEAAADHEAAAASTRQERSEIPALVEQLRDELDRPEGRPRTQLADAATVAQMEDALARARARLAAHRAALRELERLSEDHTSSRNEAAQRLGALEHELEVLKDELRRQADSAARTELKQAARVRVLALLRAGLSEQTLHRARLAFLGDRARLGPLEADLAQRRIVYAEELVALLQGAAHELRAERARQSLEEVREQIRQLSGEVPEIAEIAGETEALAETLFGPDGVMMRAEQAARALAVTRRHQSDLNRIAELTRRQFQAYGHRGSITRWWPKIPDDFPEPGAVAAVIQDLDEEIPEVEHNLISYEQQRSRARGLSRQTMIELESTYGEGLDAEAEQRVRDLFEVRRDLLDALILRGRRYSDLLVEYRTIAANLQAQMQGVERVLYEQLLWSRSVPRPLIPRPGDMASAFQWLTSTEHLQGLPVRARELVRLDGVVVLALLTLIVVLRRPLRRRLVEISKSVSDPKRDSLRFTMEALAITAVMAAPVPTALYTASAALGAVGGSVYWLAAARAFSYVALVALLLESIRHIFAPSGLAEVHFGWPGEATRPLRRGLLATQAVGLPLLYVALHLAFAGMRLQSPEELQLHNNSLGRVAFVAALLFLGLSILGMLRPERRERATEQHVRVAWPRRFAGYAFPAAFLGAYPVVVLATLVPAALATAGFYITGMLLAYQMLRTMLLAAVLMVVGGLVHRWRVVNRNRVLRAAVGQPDEESQRKEYEAADKQAHQLFRFGALVVIAVGLFSIWSDALPMLQILKRVQLLPRVELLDRTEDSLSELATVRPAAASQPESPEETPASAPEAAGTADESAATDAGEAGPAPLTLWNLLEAILAGLIALGLVRNLPGVIEIELRRRTTLDGGARFALSTLVRYSIIIIGAVAVFGLLGITWGKVQWLAAALTFGLGFGLQEIVANFVSGLILLIERPVRVGDVVTIGNLMGTVSRIQIRATTITLWDRSEMIVPNKEFITTKLVNWTLSDSKRRIEIPVRIAHGTDLEQVKSVLVDTARQHPSVLDDPAPVALVLGIGEDTVNIELRCVVDFGQGLSTLDEVQIAVERRFLEEGIEFALPTSEVRLQRGSESP